MNHKCPKCGAEVADQVKYCPECGTAQKTVREKKSPLKTPDKKPPAKFSGTNIIMIVTILSLVIVGIYGYPYLMPAKKQDPQARVPAGSQTPSDAVFDQQHYQHLLEDVQKNPDGYIEKVDLANFLFDNHRFAEALTYYDQALAINPQSPNVLVDAGVSHFNLRQFPEAKTFFLKALAVDSQHVNALYNMGVVSAQLGDMAGMFKYWETLVSTAPQTPQAQNALQMLDEIRKSNPSDN